MCRLIEGPYAPPRSVVSKVTDLRVKTQHMGNSFV